MLEFPTRDPDCLSSATVLKLVGDKTLLEALRVVARLWLKASHDGIRLVSRLLSAMLLVCRSRAGWSTHKSAHPGRVHLHLNSIR